MSFRNDDNFDAESYVKVNTRLQEFHERYPNGRVWTGFNFTPTGILVMRCELYREANDTLPAATGHSFLESLSGEKVGEYTETVAVGRALALMGFKIEKSLASGEEMSRFKERQESRQATKQESKIRAAAKQEVRTEADVGSKEPQSISPTPEVPKTLRASRIFKPRSKDASNEGASNG